MKGEGNYNFYGGVTVTDGKGNASESNYADRESRIEHSYATQGEIISLQEQKAALERQPYSANAMREIQRLEDKIQLAKDTHNMLSGGGNSGSGNSGNGNNETGYPEWMMPE